MALKPADKRAEQKQGISYGCHCDLEPGQQPDGCVIDEGRRGDCVNALHHRTREACRYWQPVDAKVTA